MRTSGTRAGFNSEKFERGVSNRDQSFVSEKQKQNNFLFECLMA